jgi:hypothetical protein
VHVAIALTRLRQAQPGASPPVAFLPDATYLIDAAETLGFSRGADEPDAAYLQRVFGISEAR